MFLFVFNQHYNCTILNKFEFVCFVLGCYSIESLHDVMNKTMIKSSVGICQEICHHEHIDKFAVKVYLM